MRNSIYPYWRKEATTVFYHGRNGVPLHFIVGAVGLLALAVSLQHVMPDDPTQRDVPAAVYDARQAELGDMAYARSEVDFICLASGVHLPARLHQSNHQFMESLITYIGSTYKIPSALAHEIVDAIFAASRKNDMDPLLVLGIIAKESSFNHKARSSYGATGLMQIHPPSHQELLKEIGIRDRDPKMVQKKLTSKVRLNVTAGIRIYKAYENQYGSAVKALQAYNGAKHDPTQRYAKNVLATREDFKRMALQHGACG